MYGAGVWENGLHQNAKHQRVQSRHDTARTCCHKASLLQQGIISRQFCSERAKACSQKTCHLCRLRRAPQVLEGTTNKIAELCDSFHFTEEDSRPLQLLMLVTRGFPCFVAILDCQSRGLRLEARSGLNMNRSTIYCPSTII
jgi:hypothetical protein